MKRIASHVVPSGFGGQVAAIVLLGFVLSQAFAGVLYMGLLPHWQRLLRPDAAIGKIEVIVRLIESLPYAERGRTALLLGERSFQVWFTAGPTRSDGAIVARGDVDLQRQLAEKLDRPATQVQVRSSAAGAEVDVKLIDIALRGGGNLAIATSVGQEHRLGFVEEASFAVFLLLVLAGLGAWLTWTVNAPLMRFARAAERIGTDVNAPPFPEQGPSQLRRVIRAFNEMQQRLQRLLGDRTRMLAAISHDLRTPLTRIRLRLETGRAAGEIDKLVTDIETMEAMLTSTLAFVRGVEADEASEAVDLDLLLQTVCDLISDVGGNVSYDSPGRCRYLCRPQSLMRAFTNVVANAAKYGERARVSLRPTASGSFVVEICDDGPGIPPAEREKVFEPFYRTDSALAANSEGIGLGLSIARAIVLAHGGTIELLDADGRGLRVRITLPPVPPA